MHLAKCFPANPNCTDSVSICEAADLFMGNSVTWGQRVNSHDPPSVSPRSPSTPPAASYYMTWFLFCFWSSLGFYSVTIWQRTTPCLLHISCDSSGEPCLYWQREREMLGKTAKKELISRSLFPHVSSRILWDTCTVRLWREKQWRKGFPQCMCVQYVWLYGGSQGIGPWLCEQELFWHAVTWLLCLPHTHGEGEKKKYDVSTPTVLLWKNITVAESQ